MTREQIAEMIKALGPEVARELIDSANRSAPGRTIGEKVANSGSVYATRARSGRSPSA